MNDSYIAGRAPSERLLYFDLLGVFDNAILKHHRTEMINIFDRAHLPSPNAEGTANVLLADATLYGLLRR